VADGAWLRLSGCRGRLVSRRVLAWRLSITMEVEFCLEAVEEALAKHGRPEIFNTDQGRQFTSAAFTDVL
jgi:putative transposase